MGLIRALRPGELMPEGAVLFSSVRAQGSSSSDHDPIRIAIAISADRAYETMKSRHLQAWQRPRQEQDNPPAPAATPEEARARMIARLSEAYKVVHR